MKFYKMDHRGGLDQALLTRVQICEDQFKWYTSYFEYEYYCFDERINCFRFIKKDMPKGDHPDWLLIEV